MTEDADDSRRTDTGDMAEGSTVDRSESGRVALRYGASRDLAGLGVGMDQALGVTRILIGALILMTGIMKITVPMLRTAWSGQLRQARLPFYELTFWVTPVVELTVGTLLIVGVWTRPAAVVVLLMMLGAVYVHLVVDDPSVFPLQPNAPIIPVVVIGLTVFVLVGGTGDWSVG